MNETTNTGKNKPLNLRLIFILNALKIILSTALFIAFRYFGLTVGELSGASGASIILYTTFAYLATFTVMVVCILRRSLAGVRLAILADILISLPAKALIGVLVAVIGIGLTFTQSVKQYFSWRNGKQQ